jgi:hypothetical protein
MRALRVWRACGQHMTPVLAGGVPIDALREGETVPADQIIRTACDALAASAHAD